MLKVVYGLRVLWCGAVEDPGQQNFGVSHVLAGQ